MKSKNYILQWGIDKKAVKYSVLQKKDCLWKNVVDIYNTDINNIEVFCTCDNKQAIYRINYYNMDSENVVPYFSKDFYIRANEKSVFCFEYPNPHINSILRNTNDIKLVWDEVSGVSCYRVFKEEKDKRWEKIVDVCGNSCVLKYMNYSEDCRFTIRGLSDDRKKYLTDYDM